MPLIVTLQKPPFDVTRTLPVLAPPGVGSPPELPPCATAAWSARTIRFWIVFVSPCAAVNVIVSGT